MSNKPNYCNTNFVFASPWTFRGCTKASQPIGDAPNLCVALNLICNFARYSCILCVCASFRLSIYMLRYIHNKIYIYIPSNCFFGGRALKTSKIGNGHPKIINQWTRLSHAQELCRIPLEFCFRKSMVGEASLNQLKLFFCQIIGFPLLSLNGGFKQAKQSKLEVKIIPFWTTSECQVLGRQAICAAGMEWSCVVWDHWNDWQKKRPSNIYQR